MINGLYQKRFAKFEAEKRASLGDEAFLKKYISAFLKNDKFMKILLPINIILFAANLALQSVLYIQTGNLLNLIIIILSATVIAVWTFVAIIYCTHRFKFHAQKVKEWTEQLKAINAAQQSGTQNI